MGFGWFGLEYLLVWIAYSLETWYYNIVYILKRRSPQKVKRRLTIFSIIYRFINLRSYYLSFSLLLFLPGFLMPVDACWCPVSVSWAGKVVSRRFDCPLVWSWRIEGKTPRKAVSVRLNAFALKSPYLSLTLALLYNSVLCLILGKVVT